MDSPVDKLRIADPTLAAFIKRQLNHHPHAEEAEGLIAGDVLNVMALGDLNMGKKIAAAHFSLLKSASSPAQSKQMSQVIRLRSDMKPSHLELMLDTLPHVLMAASPPMLGALVKVFDDLRQKDLYITTAKAALRRLVSFLNQGDKDSGLEMLRVLADLLAKDLEFSQVLHLSGLLSGAFEKAVPDKRLSQLVCLRRIIRQPYPIIASFLIGVEKGLYLLSGTELDQFICHALDKAAKNSKSAENFFNLSSCLAQEVFLSLRTAVIIKDVRTGLEHYLGVRVGKPLAVDSDARLSSTDTDQIQVRSDGQSIFLPVEIDCYPTRKMNRDLYKCLVRLEAGYYEWNTYNFDLEKLNDHLDLYPLKSREKAVFYQALQAHAENASGDISRLYKCFDNPELAAALFTLCEHCRHRQQAKTVYPGLGSRILPHFTDEILRISKAPACIPWFLFLYTFLAVDEELAVPLCPDGKMHSLARDIGEISRKMFAVRERVEDTAALLIAIYPMVAALGETPAPGSIPFGRIIVDGPFLRRNTEMETLGRQIKTELAASGLKAYASDIRNMLTRTHENVSVEDLAALIESDGRNTTGVSCLTGLFIRLQESAGIPLDSRGKLRANHENTFIYPEWGMDINGYRADHVRVVEQTLESHGNDYYQSVLADRQGLVLHIRNRFERLKPEQIAVTRQAFEGDHFDYQALIDHVIDKRAGIPPGENIYMRREKRDRDVAVLLLADLSKSTANPVEKRDKSVLDLEKEAMVLFCEALNVVGDQFAVAGYSGSGRHLLEYVWIKQFEERLDNTVKNRIHHVQAIRRTRTGGAIRHAVSRLERVPARVKLLLLIGDGFPNDSGYKREYAVADTRKAILEAASRHITTRVITVNISNITGLDEVYGIFRHNVISRVHHLPGKLLNLYSRLTK